MPPMEQLRYKPLDRDSGAIRLVRLLPGTNEPIRLELIHSNFDEEPHIPYEALSYVWGSPNEGRAVEVDVQQLTITPNLNLALLRLRRANEDRILWIDAICVNQSDDKEKSEQVAKMANTFARAEKVIIWIGESTPETDVVFHLMQFLEMEAQKYPYENWEPSDKRWLRLWSTVGNSNEDLVLQRGKGLESILSRPWFQKVWNIQEFSKAPAAEVVCGLETVSAPIFVVALFLVAGSQFQAVFGLIYGLEQKYSWSTELPDLCKSLLKHKEWLAVDFADKIYGLLGLWSHEHTKELVPDYPKISAESIQDAIAAVLGFDVGWKSTCRLPEWELSELHENLFSLVDKVSRWAVRERQLITLEAIMDRNKVRVVGSSFHPGSLLWEPILRAMRSLLL
jgi:hypothetical protein